MSGERDRSDAVQILRGLAALGVLEVHVARLWFEGSRSGAPPLTGLGAFGVDVFFVISGFVMVGAVRRAPSALSFLRQRFIRVAPLYWLHSAPWVAMWIAAGVFVFPDAVRTYLFWLGIGPKLAQPPLGVGWTLCFEIWFYIAVASAMVFGARAWIAWGVAWTICLALAWRTNWPAFQFPGSPLFVEFGIGAIVASRPVRYRPRLGLVVIVLVAAALVAYQTAIGFGKPLNAFELFVSPVGVEHLVMFGPAAGLVVWGALQTEPMVKGARGWLFLGDASYSLYLIHPVVILFAGVMWKPTGWPSWGLGIVTAVVSLAAGAASYLWIERPLLGWLRSPARRLRGSAAVIVGGR